MTPEESDDMIIRDAVLFRALPRESVALLAALLSRYVSDAGLETKFAEARAAFTDRMKKRALGAFKPGDN